MLHQAAAICLSYSDAPPGTTGPVKVTGPRGESRFEALSRPRAEFQAIMI
jgi:hypothetical protein